MGKSFFNGSTDSELAIASQLFAEKISQSWAEYGISSEMADQYAELDAQWQAAYKAASNPFTRTQARVVSKNIARRRLTAMASSLAKIIGGNPNVSDAQRISLGLSVREKASPLPPPGTPYSLGVTLHGNGALILTWKCDNPPRTRGTQYELWRRTDGEALKPLGIVGKKRFIDSTLPAGATGIFYKLRAIRTTGAGVWAEFPISFGGVPREMREFQTKGMAA